MEKGGRQGKLEGHLISQSPGNHNERFTHPPGPLQRLPASAGFNPNPGSSYQAHNSFGSSEHWANASANDKGNIDISGKHDRLIGMLHDSWYNSFLPEAYSRPRTWLRRQASGEYQNFVLVIGLFSSWTLSGTGPVGDYRIGGQHLQGDSKVVS